MTWQPLGEEMEHNKDQEGVREQLEKQLHTLSSELQTRTQERDECMAHVSGLRDERELLRQELAQTQLGVAVAATPVETSAYRKQVDATIRPTTKTINNQNCYGKLKSDVRI